MATAYLHAILLITPLGIRWGGCRIYSDQTPTTHSAGEWYAPLLEAAGESYQDAHDNLLDQLTHPGVVWMDEERRRTRAGRLRCAGCLHDEVDGCYDAMPAPKSDQLPACWEPYTSPDELHDQTFPRMNADGEHICRCPDCAQPHTTPCRPEPPQHALDPSRIPPPEEQRVLYLALRRAVAGTAHTKITQTLHDIFSPVLCVTASGTHIDVVETVDRIDDALLGRDALHGATCASWHPKRALIAVGYRDGHVRVWEWHGDAEYMEDAGFDELPQVPDPVTVVSWYQDGRGIIWESRESFKHSMEDAESLNVPRLDPAPVSHDGAWVVTTAEKSGAPE